MGSGPERLSVGILAKATDEQIERARRTVAHNATSTDDCHELLRMLGLMPDQIPTTK